MSRLKRVRGMSILPHPASPILTAVATRVPSEVETAVMLQKVREDAALPRHLRDRAVRAAGDLTQSVRALQRLQRLAENELPLIPRSQPTRGLSRVVSAGTFLRYHLEPEFREVFTTTDDFVRYVDSSADPNAELFAHLSPSPIAIPWQRSWLAPTRQIRGLSGNDLIRVLELGADAEPPFVALHMPLDRLQGAGVLVRPPCSLDSVLGPNPQWSPTGLASGVDEFVDGDVPRDAVERVEWVR